jgi:hypothetical protein
MDTASIVAMLQPMNSSEIIQVLGTLQQSGLNVSQIDTPAILSQLNVTQIEGLLESNSTIVTGLLQSLSATQLVTILTNFQNVTSTIFNAAMSTNITSQASSAYITEGKTLVSLLLARLTTTFTDSQLLGLFKILSNGAALGTGSKQLLKIAKKLISGFFGNFPIGDSIAVPTRLLNLVADYQPAIFGGYPDHKDIAPSAIFMTIFFFLSIAHAGLYFKNRSLGHNFVISLGLSFYAICRMLGFLLRVVWSKDITNIDVGLASNIFVVIPTTMLPSLNLILAQRFFTWKHPIYGSHKVFQTMMYIIYSLVVGVIVMTIIAASVQINYFLGDSHFKMVQRVIEASSVLVVIYSLASIVLVLAAYVIPPTSQDKQVLTFQPTWVKSFKFTYFVTKGAAKQEAAAVPDEQKHAIRVINSSPYHHETINQDSTPEEGAAELKHHHSIYIISFSTLVLFISDMFRCVSTFIKQYNMEHSWIFDPVVMYVMFGLLEFLVNLAFIFGRIDLRFYKPDAFKKTYPTKPLKSESSSDDKLNDEESANEKNSDVEKSI